MLPPSSSASSTFSRAGRVGRSWKNWKTMPTLCPRHLASWFSLIWRISWPAKTTRPEVGRSIPVRMFSSVDLPLPEGPVDCDETAVRNREGNPFEDCGAGPVTADDLRDRFGIDQGVNLTCHCWRFHDLHGVTSFFEHSATR
jgi:hypothetical protein